MYDIWLSLHIEDDNDDTFLNILKTADFSGGTPTSSDKVVLGYYEFIKNKNEDKAFKLMIPAIDLHLRPREMWSHKLILSLGFLCNMVAEFFYKSKMCDISVTEF